MLAIGVDGRARAGRVLYALAALLVLPACEQKTAQAVPAPSGVTATTGPAVTAPPSTASSTPAVAAVAAADPEAPPVPDTDNNTPDDAGTVDIGSVMIAADPAANGGATTEVDLVLALDPAAAQEIEKLSASAWFDERGTYTSTDRAQVLTWQVAAGANIPETPVDETGTPKAAFVFARYKTPGDHRQKIDGEGALSITLGPQDFTAEVAQ